MDLKLYDTLTREKRPFRPIDWQDSSILPDRRHVRMYVYLPEQGLNRWYDGIGGYGLQSKNI